MSDIEALKKENETLKQQLANNSQGVHNLMNQLDALKGELADARTISMQLRINLVNTQKANQQLSEELKSIQDKINAKEIPNKGK